MEFISDAHPTDKASSSQSQAVVVTKAILDSLEADTMHESWQKALQPEFNKPYFTKVMNVSRIKFCLTDIVTVEDILVSRTCIAHYIPYE